MVGPVYMYSAVVAIIGPLPVRSLIEVAHEFRCPLAILYEQGMANSVHIDRLLKNVVVFVGG